MLCCAVLSSSVQFALSQVMESNTLLSIECMVRLLGTTQVLGKMEQPALSACCAVLRYRLLSGLLSPLHGIKARF